MRTRSPLLILLAIAGAARPDDARAQLDPLLFLKQTRPNVLLVVDTAERMQRDANNDYYDPFVYPRTGAAWETTLGVSAATASSHYRRKYIGLQYTDPAAGTGDRFDAQSIAPVGDRSTDYTTFEWPTRLSIARLGLKRAVEQNTSGVRFGLLKMRQASPAKATRGNEEPVKVVDPLQNDPTETGTHAKWRISRNTVAAANGSAAAGAPVVAVDASNANRRIVNILQNRTHSDDDDDDDEGECEDDDDDGGGECVLIPAGREARSVIDVPVDNMLDDAKAEAQRLIGADTECRNTIVVLVVGGGEGTTTGEDVAAKASQFLAVSGRRIPIYVIAIAPPAADVAQLRAVAANSGGQYFEITAAMIAATTRGEAVPEVVRAVNTAVQHALVPPATFNLAPTPQLPYGTPSEFQVTSPVVGTVNLESALAADGSILPDTRILRGSSVIPQRSNVLVTSGFELPGFAGRLHAFRVYRPVADSSRPAGYRFERDFTRLWTASTPAADSRNIYTVLPAGTVVPLTTGNAAVLAPYLRVSDAAGLIQYIRSLPLGAVIGSTPAIMDAPSLDPPPDADYPAFAEANKNRRSILFVGGNSGMIHAIDARLGVEVWALVPFNLLPKLRALREGQPIDRFSYFVDSSPKVADVKVGGRWRTYLFVGQGIGGQFYQALDVTLDGIAAVVSPTENNPSVVVGYFGGSNRIAPVWSFPRYNSFDWTYGTYGDLAATALPVEKTVGETWSDPAVAQVESASGRYVVLTGSGFLRYSVQRQGNRGGVVGGSTFYMLDAENGAVLDSRDVGNDGQAETVDDCASIGDCSRLKNALQSDPVATGPADSRFITKAYIGDLDGRIWRFDIGLNGSLVPVFKAPPLRLYTVSSGSGSAAEHPIFSSIATVNVGGTQQYLFIGTGSELLPRRGLTAQYTLQVILDNGASASRTAEIQLTRPSGSTGEFVTAFPAVAGDIVFFTTNRFTGTGACGATTGALYAFTFIGGPAYDTNNDGAITSSRRGGGDSTTVRTTSSRVSAPFIVDQHLSMAAGGTVEMFGDPNDFNNGVGQTGVRILSWREVR